MAAQRMGIAEYRGRWAGILSTGARRRATRRFLSQPEKTVDIGAGVAGEAFTGKAIHTAPGRGAHAEQATLASCSRSRLMKPAYVVQVWAASPWPLHRRSILIFYRHQRFFKKA